MQNISREKKGRFNLDISQCSVWKVTTPVNHVKQLPVYLVECGHFYAKRNYYTERNNIDMYLIIYTLSGEGKIVIKDREYNALPHTMILIDCNASHFYSTVGEHWNFQWVQFSGSSAGTYSRFINHSTNIVSNHAKIDFIFISLFKYIEMKDMLGNINSTCQIIGLLTYLAELSALSTSSPEDKTSSNSMILEAVEYIENNYMKNLTLDALCLISHLSKYHFSREFKKYTGSTPYEYITSIRMNQAKILLNTTNLTLDQIAKLIGLGDGKNFIRQFRKSTGIAPTAYRKNAYHKPSAQ